MPSTGIQAQVCSPIINIGQTPVSDAGLQTVITTIFQGNEINNIFENVTKTLLQSQESRFEQFLRINNIATLFMHPVDCQDIRLRGHTLSGVYDIYPGNSVRRFRVLCDMDTDGGGWTVIQRRVNGSVDFDRAWNDYQVGFGSAGHEYWLGNQPVHELTSRAWYELRVDMRASSSDNKYAKYTVFQIGDVESGYRLLLDGYSGNGHSTMKRNFDYHSGMKFSTHDRDQDGHSSHCAQRYKGGWWYNGCHYLNFNGSTAQQTRLASPAMDGQAPWNL